MPNFRPLSRANSMNSRDHSQQTKNNLDSIPLSQLITNHLGKNVKVEEQKGENEEDDQLIGDSNFDNAGVGSEFVNIFKAFDDDDLIDDGFTQTNHYLRAEFNEKPARRFGTKEKTPTPKWDDEETKLFYKVLSMCGTDFSMISKFFPKRTRKMIANKFRNEQMKNHDKVMACIEEHKPLDLNLYATIVGIDESSIIDDYQKNKGKLTGDDLFNSQKRSTNSRSHKNTEEKESDDDESTWVDVSDEENKNTDPDNDEIEGDLNF